MASDLKTYTCANTGDSAFRRLIAHIFSPRGKLFPERKEETLRFRRTFLLCLILLGCGQTDRQGYSINTDGWSPSEIVDGVPVYSSVTDKERCAIHVGNRIAEDLYGIPCIYPHIKFVEFLHSPDDPIPEICMPDGCASVWRALPKIETVPSTKPGYDGYIFDRAYVFVAVYPDWMDHFLLDTYIHEALDHGLMGYGIAEHDGAFDQVHEKHVQAAWEILRSNDLEACQGWDHWSLNWVLP